jgi:adenine-specific DNA-methyltransferase
MVQLPEPCAEESEAFKAGYKTIAEIGKERIRRVIQKITTENTENTEKEKADNPLFHQDKASVSSVSSVVQPPGFKVFKLDRSNFKAWQAEAADGITAEAISKQLELGVDHIDLKSTPDDILYELLMKSGFELTAKVETLKLADKTVYSIAGGALLICLEPALTKEVITAMAKLSPARVLCLDRGFAGNDQLKTNAVQIMKSHEVEDFRTV